MTEVQDLEYGVPLDSEVPHLHVLYMERNHVMNSLKQLPVSEVNESTISNNS